MSHSEISKTAYPFREHHSFLQDTAMSFAAHGILYAAQRSDTRGKQETERERKREREREFSKREKKNTQQKEKGKQT